MWIQHSLVMYGSPVFKINTKAKYVRKNMTLLTINPRCGGASFYSENKNWQVTLTAKRIFNQTLYKEKILKF